MIRILSNLINLPKKGVKFFILYLAFSFAITFVFISAFANQKINSTAYSFSSQVISENTNFNIGKNNSNSSGTDITWVGEDGNWSDSANWSLGYVPTGNDNVLLSSSSSILIEVDGNFSVNDLILDTGAVIEFGGGSLTVNGDYLQADGIIILDSGKFEVKGDFNFLGGDFKAEDAELSFTGDSAQVISFPFYKEDFIVSHMVLKNGGAGRPKIFPGGIDVLVENMDILAGVQLALDSNKKTEYTVNKNFRYGGMGGGANLDSLTFFLKDTNGVFGTPFSADNSSSNANITDDIEDKLSKLKTIKYEFVQGKESDNVKALLSISSDNKAINNEVYEEPSGKSNTEVKKSVVEDIYTREKLKGVIENILASQKSDERIVIVLEDGTIIKEPQINIDNTDPNPVLNFNVEISKYSKYRLQNYLIFDTNKTLTIYGRIDMNDYRIYGAGNLEVYGDTGVYQENGVIAIYSNPAISLGLSTQYYSTGGLITPVIDYNSWSFQIIADAWHPANTFVRCSNVGTKSLSGDFKITNGSDTGPARDSISNTKAAFWVKPGATFDNFGYNVIFDGGVFNPYANVIIQGNCITDHRGKISWKTSTASTLFAGNNINLNEIELNSFLNQVNYLRPAGDSAVSITARRFSFTGTSPGKWELSKVAATNITIRDSIYINPDNPASYGGALIGNNSIPTHITLQGSIISKSNNAVQDIVNGMENTTFEFYAVSPAIIFENAPANVTFFPNTIFSLYSSNPVLLTNNSPSPCAFTLGDNGTIKVTYGRFILGEADVFKYNQVNSYLIFDGGNVDSILWPVTDGPVNVTLNASPVVVPGSRTIPGTLTMIGGMFDFGTDTLTIGTSTSNMGDIIFNGGGTVRGFIKRWYDADTSSFKIFPLNDYKDKFWGLPVPAGLSFTTAPSHGGTIIAKYTPAGSGTNGFPIASGPGGDIVNVSPGFWTFTSSDSLTGGVYTMECTGIFGTGGVNNLSSLSLLKRDNSSSPWTWNAAGHLPATGTVNTPTVRFQGFTSFSDFAIGSAADNPLPVELASFTSTVNARDVILNWSTTYENNNSGFDIERLDADNYIGNWIKVISVPGSGTTSETKNYSFTDKKLNTGKYKYRLKQIDFNGNFEYFELDNEIEVGVPKEFKLSQNYPNPFNPVTKIDYDIPFESKVSLKIYDMLGREVANMVNNELQIAGYYTLQLNGANMGSGTYFFRIIAQGTNGKEFVMTKKMMLIK